MSVRASNHPSLHPSQLRPVRRRLQLSIRDAGLTDVNLAARDHPAPFWELEPTPLIIESQEWGIIDAALRQRAHFVNALLVDLYSRQECLHQRLIPPEVILSDPYYRRPCLGLEPDRASPATLLRFDLVRSKDGWLFSDTKANTPIGLSYAVQNRRFMTQEAAELYRAIPDYHSVINFPLELLDALRNLSPGVSRAPSIVVLTAGPHDPFYSEHSFLARKMGLPLARGDDLLVLDNRVYFKTIQGIEPVDVIYRRLNDAHIDPVVFSTDRETAGIPGLLQCIRARTVVLANTIGTGIAESRSINAYLPRLMRFYLGERPILPTITTYTCGDTDQLDFVLDQREKFRIRPAHDPRLGDPTIGRPLPALLNETGVAQVVRENPHAFVAQPRMESLCPGKKSRGKCPETLSAFVLCQGRHFSVFPGGLVRLGNWDTAIDRVGKSADAIVLISDERNSGEVADYERLTPPGVQTHALGSRAAENLYWLGRYLERAESTARMLSILDDVALEEIPPRERRRWLPVWRGLLEATGHAQEKITARTNPQLTLSFDMMWRMSLDRSNASSIFSSVLACVENARQLRDHVSPEAWTILSRLKSRFDSLARREFSHSRRRSVSQSASSPSDAMEAAQLALSEINALLGTAERTMLQDASWHFLWIGVHLERATMTCSALRHVLASGIYRQPHGRKGATPATFQDNPELSALLRMLGSQDAYRRLYQTRSQWHLVSHLFLKQDNAPRSILHNVQQIHSFLLRVSCGDKVCSNTAPESVEVTLKLKASLAEISTEAPPGAKQAQTSDPLSSLLGQLFDVHKSLSDNFFNHQARFDS